MLRKLYLFILLISTSLCFANISQDSVGDYLCTINHLDEDLTSSSKICKMSIKKSKGKYSIELASDLKYKGHSFVHNDKIFVYNSETWWKGHVLKSKNQRHEANIVPYEKDQKTAMAISLNFYAKETWYIRKAMDMSCIQVKASDNSVKNQSM